MSYFKDKRNWLHALIGYTLGYGITMFFGFSNRDNFLLDWRLFLCPFVGAILVSFGAFLWEHEQDKITPGVSDMRDVAFSGVSAFIGGFISLFYSNLIIAIILSAISLVTLIKNYKK